jgi:hypothetical protein
VRRYQPALLGGLFIGVLSSLPFVNSANACCCLWVVTGGLLTTYLLQQNAAAPVETSDAALQGLAAGAVGAVLNLIVLVVLLNGMAAGASLEDTIRGILDQNAQVPPEVRDRALNIVSSGFLPALIAVVTIPVYAVFGMLGSLLGVALFRKKAPPEGA